jgi:uncharacterized protein (TIGR03435 family)
MKRAALLAFALALSALPLASLPSTWAQTAAASGYSADQKLEFDVASVRQNKTSTADSDGDPEFQNVPMGPEETFRKTGGVFTARNTPLLKLISFAYKVTTGQRDVFRASMPDWVITERYNVEARTENQDVTKDQMRAMMRSLLADRFKLIAHRETRMASVYAVVLVKPGILGPHLRPHPADEPCSTIAPPLGKPSPDAAPPAPRTVAGGYPATCGGFARMEPSQPWLRHEGARNMPMAATVTAFTGLGVLGRPVVDRTGLFGNYDWVMEFLQDAPPGVEYQLPPDATGPKFTDALRDQLGLKLESAKAPIEFVIVDQVEHATEN